MKVEIPTNIEDKLKLAQKINAKHQADGADSELRLQPWDALSPTIGTALAYHEEAEDLKRKMNKAYEQRDLLVGPIDAAIKNSRDVLTGNHKNEMKRLGDWGFTVTESSTASKSKSNA
jgi:hypothetical protein